MEISDLKLKGLKLLKPLVHSDERGFFCETFRQELLSKEIFVQDNHSFSCANCLRGLHYQQGFKQTKLVYVILGQILDIAVDIRVDSPTFGQWQSVILDDKNHFQLLIPGGFAHGFSVLSENAHVVYKMTSYYDPVLEKGIAWDDPDLNIDWKIHNPILSLKDRHNPLFCEFLACR
jgi:dTDP-4-dehydrorhamnose 3,5-epimerase